MINKTEGVVVASISVSSFVILFSALIFLMGIYYWLDMSL